MKEIVIPFTWEHVLKVVCLIVSSLTVSVIVYGIMIHEYALSLFGLIIGGMVSFFIAMPGMIEYNWDMNPFHKVGYCIRLAYKSELKSFTDKTQKESTK